MVPPSTATGPPQVSPTPMALPALPPLLTSPIATAPPLAEAVATPPLPAEAISVQLSSSPQNLSWRRVWAAALVAPTSPVAAPIAPLSADDPWCHSSSRRCGRAVFLGSHRPLSEALGWVFPINASTPLLASHLFSWRDRVTNSINQLPDQSHTACQANSPNVLTTRRGDTKHVPF